MSRRSRKMNQASEAIARLNVVDSQISNLANGEYKEYKKAELVLQDYNTYYIAPSGDISSLGSPTGDSFYLREYIAEEGQLYSLAGKQVSLLGNYPLVGFKATSGTSGIVEIIMQGSTVDTDYSVDYTPKEDGYFFVADIIDKNKIIPYVTMMTDKNELESKVWVAYGNSITAGYGLPLHLDTEPSNNQYVNSYVKRIAEKNNMTFYNYGTSGRGYSVGGGGKLIDTLNTYGKVADADIVTIAMGINDYILVIDAGSDVTFGTLGDAPGSNTFIGYVKQAIARTQQLYPDSAIVVFTPLPKPDLLSDNYQGRNLLEYADAIKSVAISYGCYVGDILSKSRFNLEVSAWKDTYLADRLHPTQICVDDYLINIYENEMKKAII